MSDSGTRKIKVLLCEDEPLILMALADLINQSGMEALEAAKGEEALAFLSSCAVDVFVTDVWLPDISGLELAVQARKLKAKLPIAFSTGDRLVDGMEQVPGSMILPKPCPDDEFLAAIRKLAEEAGL